jgi:hypothetical protein
MRVPDCFGVYAGTRNRGGRLVLFGGIGVNIGLGLRLNQRSANIRYRRVCSDILACVIRTLGNRGPS